MVATRATAVTFATFTLSPVEEKFDWQNFRVHLKIAIENDWNSFKIQDVRFKFPPKSHRNFSSEIISKISFLGLLDLVPWIANETVNKENYDMIISATLSAERNCEVAIPSTDVEVDSEMISLCTEPLKYDEACGGNTPASCQTWETFGGAGDVTVWLAFTVALGALFLWWVRIPIYGVTQFCLITTTISFQNHLCWAWSCSSSTTT